MLGAAGAWIVSKVPELVLQCALIVFSIVLALAVDQWQGERSDRDLALQSLDGFEREIGANRAKLEDKTDYYVTLRDVVPRMDSAGKLRTADEFYDMLGVQSFQPPALQATAWQTAVATGALRLLDYPTVDALSRAYNQQARYERVSESRMPEFLRTGTAPQGATRAMVRATLLYMDDEVREEKSLAAEFDNALAKIAAAKRREGG